MAGRRGEPGLPPRGTSRRFARPDGDDAAGRRSIGRGIAQTDEFAYSLAGANDHYGTPPNPAAPGRLPGGSSSGPAAAVALGEVSVGLGTDTGGSIRVPAAYQGLYGIRTTHDAVSRVGLLPMAPTFDTVGWMTRDAATLARVGEVLLPASPGGRDDLVSIAQLFELADPEVAHVVRTGLDHQPLAPGRLPLEEWREAFIVLQAWEAWRAHGAWLEGRTDTLGLDVRARFERARSVTDDAAGSARANVDRARRTIRELVGDRVLVLPSAPTVAPVIGSDLRRVRDATLALTCVAGIGGLPAVTVPLTATSGLPCGLCLVAAPGRDRDLLELALRWFRQSGTGSSRRSAFSSAHRTNAATGSSRVRPRSVSE